MHIGELALWVALSFAIWSASSSFAGGALGNPLLVRIGARTAVVASMLVVCAGVALLYALLLGDLSLRFVASHTSWNLPRLYKVAAVWSGASGVMLARAVVVAAVSAAAVFWAARHASLRPWIVGTLVTLVGLYIAATLFAANPFVRLPSPPDDGLGLAPEFQHGALMVYAPLRHLGLAATAVPLAIAVAGLIDRRLDERWRNAIHGWVLAAWAFLAAAIVAGMWWAYTARGTAAVWSSETVENALVLPWLALSALVWLRGVRARSERVVGAWIVALSTLACVAAMIASYVTRLDAVAGASAELGAATASGANWSLTLMMLVVAGAVWSLVTRGARRARIAHAGFVLLGAGLLGTAFSRSHPAVVSTGSTVTAADPFGAPWTFASQGVSRARLLNRDVMMIALKPSRAGRDAGAAFIRAEQRQYYRGDLARREFTGEPSTHAGILHTLREDVYVVLDQADRTGRAAVRITFVPLAALIWLGAALAIMGVLVAQWRAPRTRERVPESDAGARADQLIAAARGGGDTQS